MLIPTVPEKLLLDTDIGSDIDDAVCLAYLLANPACELLGITTVTGNTTQRARLASALCRAAGKEAVPIFPGRTQPLTIPQKQPQVPQAAALERWPHATGFPRGEAVAFLRRTIRAHPGEVTLLGIGPMTNIAALFAADEEIPSLLKRLVLMCGAFSNRVAGLPPCEWNALVDPDAAAIVYAARPAVHRSVGLDVTSQVTLPAEEVRRRFQRARGLRPVLDFAEMWFQHTGRITFHDPLAAATIFEESICGYERGRVQVERQSEPLAGLTRWTPAPAGQEAAGGPHEVALTVRPEAFFEHYFSFFPDEG